MRRSVVVLVVAAALAAPLAWAGTLADVTMPDQVTVSGKTLQLNGMGLRTKLMFKIYVAGLYLEQKSKDPAQVVSSTQVKRVVMHFLSGKATKSKMDAAWHEGFEANSPQQYEALKARVDQLVGFFGDMKPGDKIEFTFEPGTTTAALNGQVKGTIPGDDFAKALLQVWLGPEPPTEELKQGMLGA
jgi:hypothetical protein